MKRRDFVVGIVAAPTWAFAARAQQPGRTYRVAVLAPFPFGLRVPFEDELRRNGLEEGRNLAIDGKGAVDPANFDAVAVELVKRHPDAIVTYGPAATQAAQHATKSVAIVAQADDLVESRVVSSVLRPGGNTTGISIFASQLDAKRLEILHELVPTARRIGILADPTQEVGLTRVRSVGRELGIELIVHEVRRTDDIVEGIDALAAATVAAINVLASAMFYAGRMNIINRTRTLGLPTIYWWADLAREGGLVGFGPNLDEVTRLHARQLLRVLRGAAPGDVPIIQPTKFELVINLKTAKALGLSIPASVLVGADEVIE